MNLKAQAGMGFLVTFVIGFLIAGIYITLGSDVTEQLQGNYYTDNYGDVLINNETLAYNNLVAHLSMDDNAETKTVLNTLSNVRNATSLRNTNLLSTAGLYNTALSFNESETDYIIFDNGALFNYGYNDTFTLSLYLNWTGEMQESIIAGDLEQWVEDYPGWVFKVLEDGTLSFIWLTETSSTESQNLTTTSAILNNTWYHIAYVNYLNGTENWAAIYINGTADVTRAKWELVNTSYNTIPISLGYAGDEADVYFNGAIDEFKIYETNLSAASLTRLADLVGNESWTEPDYYYNLTYENQLISTTYSNEAAYNVTAELQEGNISLAERLPLIALVVGIVILLGYMMMINM